MAEDNWARQWAIFHAALDVPESEREAFLRNALGDYPELLAAVRELLRAHAQSAPLLDTPPAVSTEPPLQLDAEHLIGSTIDQYVIDSIIGEGGMGVVYAAHQQVPVIRRVALKLIKLGMNTREVVARFQQERQALASMNHPNIASVFDAGATADGRPYFVMELVAGEPLTTYCDRHRLNARSRLTLFLDVLAGIRHAHQKGIIHRDLKPTNVLADATYGKPMVKIIDFGIAKATDQVAVEKTLFTSAGRLLGTPAYMSPEQAMLTEAGIDIRTDIYSASVLLYELLTGTVPFPNESLLSAGFAEMQRILREQEPPAPSRRLATLDDDTLTDLAAARGSTARVLPREIEGDLDWIVLKGLEKDPTRRYGSAGELADDLERFLNDLPVLARPPGALYRAGKFARRHRFGVAVSTAAVIALLVFAGSTSWQSRQLAAALAGAQVEQRKAERVTEFLIKLLAESDPNNALGDTVSVKEALDRGAERLRNELNEEPVVKAEILVQMAEIYRELGDYENAATLLELTTAILSEASVSDRELEVEVAQVLANLHHDRGEYGQAERWYHTTLERQRALAPQHAHVVRALKDLGTLYFDTGDYPRSVTTLKEAVAIGRQAFPDGDVLLATALATLAYAHYQAGDNRTAQPLFEEAEAMLRAATGNRTLELAYVLSNYGNFQRDQGRLDDAIETQREVAEIYRMVLGPNHAYYALALINLSSAYNRGGRLEEAEATAQAAVERHEAIFPGDHPNKASAYYELAAAQSALGRYAEAEANFRSVLEVDTANLGAEHPYVFSDLEQISVALKNQGKLDAAAKLQREALAGRLRVLGPEHPDTASAWLNLSGVLGLLGDNAGSTAAAERAVEILRGEDPTNLQLNAAKAALGSAYHREARYAEAEALYRELLAGYRKTLPQNHPNVAVALHGIGVARLALKDPAVEVLEEALAIREASQGPEHPHTVLTREALEKSRRAAGM